MKRKLEYITIGYGFLFLNMYATLNSLAIWGIGFGLVSGVFFIKALRVK